MSLSRLSPPDGAVKDKKRVGRGNASGWGKTAGKGHKGHKARAGKNKAISFEGGQMPIIRRVPKRGFSNARFAKEYAVVNLADLSGFEAGATVDPQALLERRVIRKSLDGLKILSEGDLTVALTVKAHKFSARAKEKILAAGGQAEEIKE